MALHKYSLQLLQCALYYYHCEIFLEEPRTPRVALRYLSLRKKPVPKQISPNPSLLGSP